MSHTLHRKYTEIPLLINDNLKYVKGVSKYTTCSDVIKMILKKTDVGASVKNASDGYGIYERSRGIERLLPGKCRILKVMRSWGTDVEYELVFRPVSTTYSVPKISEAKRRKLTNRHRAIHAETLAGLVEAQKDKLNKAENGRDFVKEIYDSDASMDDFLSQVDRNNMKGILQFCDAVSNEEINKMSSANVSRNVTGQSESFGSVSSPNVTTNYNVNDVKYAVRKTLKTKQCVSSSESNKSGTEIHATPNIKAAKERSRSLKARHEKFANDIASKVARMNQKEGKEALLQKYFADYITYRSPGYNYLDTRYRERGDGAESSSEVPNCRRADGAEINAGVNTVTPKLRSSRTSLDFNRDNHDDVSSDSGQEDDTGSLDTAFILNQALVVPARVVDTSDIASGYKVPNVSPCIDEFENDVEDEDHHDDIFNTNIITGSGCHINKLVDYSFSEDDSILTDDPSIISSVSENVHDVSSVSDIVRGLFGEQKAASEDDEMESFMNTKLCDDFSDEGLSSLGSDDDREIMV